MAGITKKRYEEIQEAAMKMVAFYGIKNIDAVSPLNRKPILRGWAAQLMEDFSITLNPARQHVARASRRQRHPDWQPPQNWGGAGRGQGRKAG